MSAVCIVDTSAFCNILNVPFRNQRHAESVAELAAMIARRHTLLLPLAAIYETGNYTTVQSSACIRPSAGLNEWPATVPLLLMPVARVGPPRPGNSTKPVLFDQKNARMRLGESAYRKRPTTSPALFKFVARL